MILVNHVGYGCLLISHSHTVLSRWDLNWDNLIQTITKKTRTEWCWIWLIDSSVCQSAVERSGLLLHKYGGFSLYPYHLPHTITHIHTHKQCLWSLTLNMSTLLKSSPMSRSSRPIASACMSPAAFCCLVLEGLGEIPGTERKKTCRLC